MPKIVVIAALTAALSFGLMALVPAEHNVPTTAPITAKTTAAQINL